MAKTQIDDIYDGYNDYPSIYSIKDLEQDALFQGVLSTSYGKRPVFTPKVPGTAMRLGTSSGFHKTGTGIPMRPMTSGLRPMTAVRGAGYTSSSRQPFDPLNMSSNTKGPVPPLETGKEDTPEEKIKVAEKKIMVLIESSIEAAYESNTRVALERAREASSREKVLIRLQEQAGLSDNHNVELTFAVIFNLAIQYTNNNMFTEAIATYQAITRNRMFNNSARLKVNMGNIYVKMGQLSQAIKMYRMAFDQASAAHKDLRIKIMHNIGMLFVQMGRLEEAANSFEWVMKERAEFKAGLHAVLCHFALSHRDKMKRAFLELLEVQLNIDQEDRYNISTDDVASNILNEILKNDDLSKLEKELKCEAEKTILCAAKLIAPVIEDTLTAGFAWCVDSIKSSAYASLAADLEISKAMVFLHNRETQLAIDTLKMFENRESKANSSAATMLSFIYFFQGDYDQAERCGEIARTADTYNAAAYVNLSACAFRKNELNIAKEFLLCALDTDAGHVQALYNLGLVYKKQNMYEEALECFWKLRNIVRHDPQTLYQIGHLYQLMNDTDQAMEWYNQLLSIIPCDPGVLQKMGEMYDSIGDKQQAYQFYSDSYRFFPANFEVIDWLGSYFVTMQVAEKALIYFKKAVELAPDEPRWRLLVAACLRRTGQFHKALTEYQDIHNKFPENIECLKFLVRLCSDLGLKEAQLYATELKRVEKAKELKDRQGSARPGSRRSNSSTSSRTGSGMSVLSDHRSSPILGKRDNQSLNSAGVSRTNRTSSNENFMETASDVNERTKIQEPIEMVVPTEHALHEAIQVSPLLLSDDVKQQKIEQELAQMKFSAATVRQIQEVFLSEMNKGIHLEPSSLQMENTYVPELLDGTGFTFSFPMVQHSLDIGLLVTWTKTFNCPDVVNKDAVRLLREALDRRGDTKVKVVAILNDTTGTLVQGSTLDPETAIGLILGTGSNACYLERADRVEHWETERHGERQVIIDIEWGAFGDNGVLDFIKTDYDRENDANSLIVNSFTFEKYISGKYMGELVRIVLARLNRDGLLFIGEHTPGSLLIPGNLTSDLVSDIEQDSVDGGSINTEETLEKFGIVPDEDDVKIVQYVCEVISNRAALLVSTCLAVLLKRIDRERVTIAVDGSLYKHHPRLESWIKQYIPLLAPDHKFKIIHAEDGSGKGAALVAAIAQRLHERIC
ncbi:intraflagellar transport protein 88-like protein nompB isoform X5 [Megachile rotundata]|uniref:intraflagellar transport protein 88-like protein nompB isoform X5 n=1 Tax=Megachile rotundata TaxID=143995 RepID=UPI003FD1D25B